MNDLKQKQKRGGGFTLLEILIALTILGMAVTVIIQLASANTRSVIKADEYTRAALIAEVKMRELLDKTDLSEGERTEQTEDGYGIKCSVTETLAERTESLPLKLLRIELFLSHENFSHKPIVLRTSKLVAKPVLEGTSSHRNN